MVDEMITLYTREEPNKALSCKRSDYYDNDFMKYENHYPALIDVFLFNKFGDVLLQRRGRNQRNNPYKLHTTIGGHINWGENPEFSLVHECMQELGAPILLFAQDEYEEAVAKLRGYTHKTALLYEVKNYYRNFSDSEIENRRDIKDRIWLYFGLYDGPIETPDRDSAGYEWIELGVLEKEMKNSPDQFTPSLMAYTEELGDVMRGFVKKYSKA